jgi:hypothetical protein
MDHRVISKLALAATTTLVSSGLLAQTREPLRVGIITDVSCAFADAGRQVRDVNARPVT